MGTMRLNRLWRDHPQSMLDFLLRCIEIDEKASFQNRMQATLYSTPLAAVMRQLIVEQNALVISEFERCYADSGINARLKRLMAFLIDESGDLGNSTLSLTRCKANRNRLLGTVRGRANPEALPDGRRILFTSVPTFRSSLGCRV